MMEFMKSMKSDMQREIQDLKESVNFCSDKITDFESKLAKLNEYFKITELLKTENNKLKQKVGALTKKVGALKSTLRSNSVEIQDIPEKSNENLISITKAIENFLKFNFEDNMIDTVFRVQTQVENKPKNIVLKFVAKLQRDRFWQAAKAVRSQKEHQKDFKLTGVADRFYINEHLLPQTKLLLKRTREVAKEKFYKFTWVQNGNVLVRKAEKSKIVHIQNAEDLGKL